MGNRVLVSVCICSIPLGNCSCWLDGFKCTGCCKKRVCIFPPGCCYIVMYGYGKLMPCHAMHVACHTNITWFELRYLQHAQCCCSPRQTGKCCRDAKRVPTHTSCLNCNFLLSVRPFVRTFTMYTTLNRWTMEEKRRDKSLNNVSSNKPRIDR